MRAGELSSLLLLLWILLGGGLLGLVYVAAATPASDFLDAKEDQVRRIAALTALNDERACELLESCDQECSRGSCLPLKSDNPICTPVAVNTNCYKNSSSAAGYCTNIMANFQRSYIRTPRAASYDPTPSGPSDEVPTEMIDSICSQRLLDPLFQELQKLQNSSLYYFNFFFGSVEGTFRFYPGVEVSDCYNYDPRKRPWYVGAISVLKDLVIIIDAGFSMGDPLGTITSTSTKLTAVQAATQEILKTLTSNDRATVTVINGSAEAQNVAPSYVVADIGLNTSENRFTQLLFAVNSTLPSTTENASVNFTAGLNKAISTFNDSSPIGAMKIVILFTDGLTSPSKAELVSVLKEIEEQPIRLFIFEVDRLNSDLGDLACQAGGFAVKLNNLAFTQNPLFTLSAYYSFLARSQRASPNGAKPFWQRAYTDYGNLGSVITVAYPALSSDGERLLGVAGIDVQVDGLGLNLRTQLDAELLNDRRTDVSTNTNGTAVKVCDPAPDDNPAGCPSISNTSFSPLCAMDDQTSTYQERVCCPNCGLSSNSSSSNSTVGGSGSDSSDSSNAVIIAVTVPVAVVLFTAFLAFVVWRKCVRKKPQPQDVDFVKIHKFSNEALSLATKNFSDENKLGFGTFGTVYCGTLADGSKVAVKRLYFQPNHGLRDFEAEIKVLVRVNHTNLVALKGFCTEPSHLLVYEFVENGDLDNWLFVKPVKDNRILPWPARVIIAKGVARGLAYLHEELQNHQKVCHSDIKPANILLDAEFNPKVADFGTAQLYEGGSEMISTGGTLGYVAPEILHGAGITTRIDVYSYGMVLLEMVTGRRFSDRSIRNLPAWAKLGMAEHKEAELFDPFLGELREADEEMAKRLIGIALLCTSPNPDLRPDMSEVVKMIEGFLPVRALPVSLEDDDLAGLSNMASRNTSSFGFTRSPAESSDSVPFAWDKTFRFSDAIKKLRSRAGTPTYNSPRPSSEIERQESRSRGAGVVRSPQLRDLMRSDK